jgi:hypothetical protein
MSERKKVEDMKNKIRIILNQGLEIDYGLQKKYFSVDAKFNDFNDI